MSKRQVLLLIYRYFLTKFEGRVQFSKKEDTMIIDFLLTLHLEYNLRSISSQYLFDYIASQFNYREGMVTDFEKYSVQNIFGRSSLKKYMESRDKFRFKYGIGLFLEKYGIRYHDIIKPIEKRLDLSESLDKKRFHNTPAGFLFCLETTTLYSSKSRECLSCNFRERCKKIKKDVWRAEV